MVITSQHLNASALKIFVAGKIDATTAAEFRREVAKISAGAKEIIFDLSDVDYISSAGLRELLICRKKFLDVQLENLRRDVYQIFLVTGFDKSFTITQAQNVAPSVSALNAVVDAEDSSPYVRVSFKKFLRDKATYSAKKKFRRLRGRGVHVARH